MAYVCSRRIGKCGLKKAPVSIAIKETRLANVTSGKIGSRRRGVAYSTLLGARNEHRL
jgi:hypothetical protein